MAMKFTLLLVYLAWNVIFALAKDNTCKQQQPCTCDFKKESDVGLQKTEILAGAAGALSPLLATGIAVGLYKMLKKSPSPAEKPGFEFERKASDVSSDSYAGHSRRRPRKSSVTPEDSDFRRREDFYSRRGSTPLSMTQIENDFDDGYIFPSDMNPIYESWRQTGTVGANSRSRVRDNLNSWM